MTKRFPDATADDRKRQRVGCVQHTDPSNHSEPVEEVRTMADSHHICVVDGCSKQSRTKQMCVAHYNRWRRRGTVEPFFPGHTQSEEFIYGMDWIGVDACIEWPFQIDNNGYGRAYSKGKKWRAHRLSLIIHVGEAPSRSHHAAHEPIKCHNRACVNPNHLRWTTAKENCADKRRDGTHLRGTQCNTNKLTEDDVLEIRKRLSNGESQVQIAQDYGVSQPNISAIKRGKSWGWIDGQSEAVRS